MVYPAQAAAIAFNSLTFVTTLVFNQQSSKVSWIFPRKTGAVSDKYPTDITPAGGTFAIWGVIYFLQIAWIIYSISLIFRPTAANILPVCFYLIYSLTCMLNVAWLIVWARQMFTAAFIIIVLFALALYACLFLAYTSLDKYLTQFAAGSQATISKDVWCIRFLVQNGIIFYAAWVSIASCINLAIFLQAENGIRRDKAGTISLCILLTILIIWFAIENFVAARYTRYTFVEYIVLLIGLSGILTKQWTDGHGNQAFVLAILVLSGLMFGARLMIILVTEKNLPSKVNIGL